MFARSLVFVTSINKGFEETSAHLILHSISRLNCSPCVKLLLACIVSQAVGRIENDGFDKVKGLVGGCPSAVEARGSVAGWSEIDVCIHLFALT